MKAHGCADVDMCGYVVLFRYMYYAYIIIGVRIHMHTYDCESVGVWVYVGVSVSSILKTIHTTHRNTHDIHTVKDECKG